MVDGDTSEQLLVQAGHRNDFHAGILGIQECLEGFTLHLAGNGNDNLRHGFFINNFEQTIVSRQDRESVHSFPDLVGVVIHETDQEKGWERSPL